MRRERRRRVAEMGERVEGMRGALRKANDIVFEEELLRTNYQNQKDMNLIIYELIFL